MSDVCLLNCEKYRDTLIGMCGAISNQRQQRVHALKNKDNAAPIIGGEALLACVLSLPLPLALCHRENGKPFIKGALPFNLSHSGSIVVAVSSDSEVGIDIESVSRFESHLAKRILSAGEARAAQGLSGDALRLFLCKSWVFKESYLKYTGEGLRRPLSSLGYVNGKAEGIEEGLFFYFYSYQDYIICLCTKSSVKPAFSEISGKSLEALCR